MSKCPGDIINKIVVIVYGDGGGLGNFKVFADSLQRELTNKYTKILSKYVNRDTTFFNAINSITSDEKIEELHIFSHSIGAGLFLGYKDPSIAAKREAVWTAANHARRKVTYSEAVKTEIGAVQTDDLVVGIGTIAAQKATLQSKFTPSAFIKIWGCNSGIAGWVYNDNGIVDPADDSEPYYWRAFNERNVPKPSIAKALAKFFNRKVYGAKSGASIEVKHKGKWISSQQYKNKIGHWPSGNLPHRLVPDKGTYDVYQP